MFGSPSCIDVEAFPLSVTAAKYSTSTFTKTLGQHMQKCFQVFAIGCSLLSLIYLTLRCTKGNRSEFLFAYSENTAVKCECSDTKRY